MIRLHPQPSSAGIQARQDRTVRVFISSMFRDMMKERALLVKEVCPELRRKCAKRFVTFTAIKKELEELNSKT